MNSEDALFETLSLNREIIEIYAPPHGGFGGSHMRGWGYYGPGLSIGEVWTNREGKRHRIYGPAVKILKKYLLEEWYKNGMLHRIGGPARSHAGNLFWYKEGKLHNLGGPAVIEKAGPRQYWIDGVKYSPKQYKWEIERRRRKGLLDD